MPSDTAAALFTVVPANPAHLPLIVDSWLRSFRESHTARCLQHYPELQAYGRLLEPDRPHPSVYHVLQRALITNLLANCPVWVAAAGVGAEVDPDTVGGWVCSAGNTLHYVYVKHEYRRIGLARMLVAAACPPGPVAYTHLTDAVQLKRLPKNWSYQRGK